MGKSGIGGVWMGWNFLRRHLSLTILVGVAGMILGICAIRLSAIAADDSFIHRRIALNYQHMGRPYFNLDQRVMVTSSPLWTVLLAASGSAVPVENPVPWLELGFVLLGAAAAYQLARQQKPRGPGGFLLPVAAFLYVFVAVVPSSLQQMETPCAVALMLTGVLGIKEKKSWGMPILVLACFARYECVLLCASSGIWITLRKQWTKVGLITSAASCFAGITWLLREYGTIIPNTVIAKSHLYFMTYRNVVRAFASIHQMLICLALGMLWWFYGRSRRGQNPDAILLVGFGVLLATAYLARKTFIFPWYLPLVLVPLSIGVLLWTKGDKLMRACSGVAFAGILLIPSATVDLQLLWAASCGSPGAIPDFPLAARVHEYRAIGTALYSECPTGILMTSEIGGLGWTFRGEIRDGAGLASPEAIRYHPMRVPQERRNGTLGEIPAAFVRDRHPDVIVSYDLLAESALPAARSLGYVDYVYPMFVRADRTWAKELWDAHQMHVLVASDGRCSPAGIDHAVRDAIEH